jgi:hypothetical protein
MDFIETVILAGNASTSSPPSITRIGVCAFSAPPHIHPRMGDTGPRNLLMDHEETANLTRIRFLIRDRDAILARVGITTVLTGCSGSPHERDYGALGEDTARRTPGPHADLEPGPSAARVARVRAALQLTDHSPPQHRYEPCLSRLKPIGSNASRYNDATTSAE